jgi:hypothetical protein
VLVSRKLDPVLAAWQFGLGRSVAWTSDAAGLWTRDWLRAPGANRFWANLVSWTLPATGTGRLFVSASSGAGQGQVSVNTPAALGANPSVTAQVLEPGGKTVSSQLEPSAPGQYRGSFPEGGQGTYFISVEARGAGHGAAGQVGLDVPYSAEYRTTGTNRALLQAVASAGGGSVISNPQSVWANNLAAAYADEPLTPWLWLLALLLLPLDVAIRRLVMTRRELLALREALPWRRPAKAPTDPALAPLAAIRLRRAERVPVAASVRAEPPTRWNRLNRAPGGSSGEGLRPSVTGPNERQDAEGETSGDASPEISTASKLLAAKRAKR